MSRIGSGVDPDLVDRVRARIASGGGEPSTAQVAAALRAEAGVFADTEVLTILKAVRAELGGAGPLEQLLREDGVTDVVVNGPDQVWVDRGAGFERAPVRFADEAAVRRLAVRLAGAARRRLDDASPFVDAMLPDGTRLHAVLPPLAPDGACVSLRVPASRGFTLAELTENGSVAPRAAELLTAIVRSRRAFLVTGGTGTGKTTLLATALGLADSRERIIVVEDTRELRVTHPHLVRLEARHANAEGAGAITVRDLVREALRMRPDRLVVGEVRGGECVDLLAALNVGHEGGCGTVHAGSAAEVPARLEALAMAAGMSREALHSQLGAAVDVVVHLVRPPGGRRRLAEIAVVRRQGALVVVVPAVVFGADGTAQAGPGVAELEGLLAGRSPGRSVAGGEQMDATR